MLSTEGKITSIRSELNTEIQEPKCWASEVFGVGRRNSSIPPLAAVKFQKCVVPLERQWRAWSGAALGKTQPGISPRHNLRPMNKRKDFHWSYLPTYNRAWPKSASSVLVIPIPWISEQGQPDRDCSCVAAAEQGNATLMLPSCQIISLFILPSF